MEILLVILQYLLPIIATVLTALLAAGAKKLIDKWGIERSEKLDRMIDDYVDKGVNAAEKVAENYLKANNKPLQGSSKKLKAVKAVMKELEQAGVTNVAQELIENRIEAMLGSKGKAQTQAEKLLK